MTVDRSFRTAIRKTALFPYAKAAVETLSSTRRQDRRRRISFYREFITRDSLVFDIGANMGNRTDPFLELGARVVAIEPQPICIKTLNQRFGRNSSFTLLPVGLADRAGQVELHLATNHVTSSMSNEFINTLQFEGSDWQESVVVRLTTLDDVIRIFGTPHFCKIDVEGFEVKVLEGLSEPISAISFEFTPDLSRNAVECIRRLTSLSPRYEFAYSPGETMSWWSEGWVDDHKAIRCAEAGGLPFGDFYARLT